MNQSGLVAFYPCFWMSRVGNSFLKDSPIWLCTWSHMRHGLLNGPVFSGLSSCSFPYILCPGHVTGYVHTLHKHLVLQTSGVHLVTPVILTLESWLNGFCFLKVYIQVSIFSRIWMTSVNLDFTCFGLIWHLVLRHVYEEGREIWRVS